MFRATYESGPAAQLTASNWIDAVNEALVTMMNDSDRDNLLTVEWNDEHDVYLFGRLITEYETEDLWARLETLRGRLARKIWTELVRREG